MKFDDVKPSYYYIMRSAVKRNNQVVIPKGAIVKVCLKNARTQTVDVYDVNATCVPFKTAFTIPAEELCEPESLIEQLTSSNANQNPEAHYTAMPIQPLEVMQAIMPRHELMGFIKGNIIKYALRAGHKLGESAAKDAAKAKRYAEWLYIVDNGGTIEFNINKEDK